MTEELTLRKNTVRKVNSGDPFAAVRQAKNAPPRKGLLILVDDSGSMDQFVDEKSKREHASSALDDLRKQTASTGVDLIIVFYADIASVLPGRNGYGTLLHKGLDFALAQDISIDRGIVLSDGMDCDEHSALTVIQHLEVPFDTIFFGPIGSGGMAFMEEIARLTKGTFYTSASGVRISEELKALGKRAIGMLSDSTRRITL
jgi:hypothetical protein